MRQSVMMPVNYASSAPASLDWALADGGIEGILRLGSLFWNS
jgi:hypothetical protein